MTDGESIVSQIRRLQAVLRTNCPWVDLRNRAQLHQSNIVRPGFFIVIEAPLELLQLEPYALAHIFMHPHDFRDLEQREQANLGPLFSYVGHEVDVAAMCLWLSRQQREQTK